MKEFQLSRYIKKWLPLIIVACAALTVAVYLFLSASQTYIASAVIHYEGENAEQGLTPVGTTLDVNEIKSSAIMTKVINNLQLDPELYSVDDLISGITIIDVVDADEELRKEAVLDLGEEYVNKPTTYIVSFEAKNREGEDFAREVLDEVLDLYFESYSEQYVNNSSTINSLDGLDQANYDYIEAVELIDENIDATLQTLNSRMNKSGTFRSVSTGWSFGDLSEQFYYIQSVKISKVFSQIFENQITKDKSLLLAKYKERISSNGITADTELEKIEDVVELINLYVEKMRNSDNTNITYEYILDEVYDKEHIDHYGNVVGGGDQTVTYDKLIYSWRDHRDSQEYAIIDSAYCNYVIDVFNRCTGVCDVLGVIKKDKPTAANDVALESENTETDESRESGVNTETGDSAETGETDDSSREPQLLTACMQSDLTCTEINDSAKYEAVKAEVEGEITQLISELSDLHRIVDETNKEYNEYLGASYISTLSTVGVDERLNVALYTAIAAVFLMVICCCIAILIGRMNDIIQYVFYLDALTGLNNRSAFDTYLKNNERRLLDDGTVCMSVVITNQIELNHIYGREEGDRLIQYFAKSLSAAFAKTKAYLVYNGKAQFIVIVEDLDLDNVRYAVQRFRFDLERRDVLRDAEIVYELGIAEAAKDDARRMRTLLSKAVSLQEKYELKN